MKLAMNMLRQYVDIPVTPEEYSERMIMTGTAVEGVEELEQFGIKVTSPRSFQSLSFGGGDYTCFDLLVEGAFERGLRLRTEPRVVRVGRIGNRASREEHANDEHCQCVYVYYHCLASCTDDARALAVAGQKAADDGLCSYLVAPNAARISVGERSRHCPGSSSSGRRNAPTDTRLSESTTRCAALHM